MNIAITIPEWVLWLIGVPLGLGVIVLALFGWVALTTYSGGIWR